MCNAWGLFDMHGNVADWCEGPVESAPTGSAEDLERMCRGGSWGSPAIDCQSAFPHRYPAGALGLQGFSRRYQFV